MTNRLFSVRSLIRACGVWGQYCVWIDWGCDTGRKSGRYHEKPNVA